MPAEENEEEYDGEAEDTVAELPPPRPKPSLDTASVSKDGSNASGQQSTRRRWSVKAMFTPRSTLGLDSHRAAAGSPQKLNAVVDAMKKENISGKTAEEVLEFAGLMLQHCATHEKIAVAAKAGALNAIADALHEHMKSKEAAIALLPPLINLSSGDDDLGLRRVSELTTFGVVEALVNVLREHGDDATACIRSVWALQHLCRRSTLSTTPWLNRALAAGLDAELVNVAARFPDDKLLQTRVHFLIASICYSLSNSGITAGMASFASLDRGAVRMRVLDSIVTALKRDPHDIERAGEEVHEAAAMALGDACATPDVSAIAVASGALGALAAAMNAQPAAGALLENAAWATKQICDHAAVEERSKVAESGVPQLIIRAIFAESPPITARLLGLREKGCRALSVLCAASPNALHEKTIEGFRNDMVEHGALAAALTAMTEHLTEPGVVTYACDCVYAVCVGEDEGGKRKRKAGELNAVDAVIGAMRKAKGPRANEVVEAAYRTLDLICELPELRAIAEKQGYKPPPPQSLSA